MPEVQVGRRVLNGTRRPNAPGRVSFESENEDGGERNAANNAARRGNSLGDQGDY